MQGYFLSAGDLTHKRWTLAAVYATDGSRKLEFIENMAGFTINEVPLTPGVASASHRFLLVEHLEQQAVPKGAVHASSACALQARKACYARAERRFQLLVTQHGVRYPSPTRGILKDGSWQAQLKPQLRGSPLLALALAPFLDGEEWTMVQDGAAWQVQSASTLVGVDTLAYRLRSYGRLTMRLKLEDDRLVVAELDPKGSCCTSLSALPKELQSKCSAYTIQN